MSDAAFITGATGFIGSQLAKTLANSGRQVRCAVRPSSNREFLEGLDVELVEVDLCDRAALQSHLKDVGTVYHVAGLVAGTRAQLHRTNVECTRELASACALMPSPPKMILVSSLAAAGPSRLDHPRSTKDPCEPVSEYGKSKLASERELSKVAADIQASIVRPGVVYGPRDRQFAQLLQLIRKARINPLVGFHDPPVGVIHVYDVVTHLLSVESRGTRVAPLSDDQQDDRGIYFAANPEPTSFGRLGRLVRSYIGRPRAWTVPIPLAVLRCAALVSGTIGYFSKKPIVFNADKIREASQIAWTCDVSKSTEELRWYPRYTIEEGFRQTVKWYFDNKWL